MILDLLNPQTVQLTDGKGMTWQQAIQLAAQPLIDNGTIETGYVNDIMKVVESEGPYINIGPQIALAHSRPTDDVHRIGLSVLKTNETISLVTDEHPIKLWIVLAAVDNTSHLTLIQELMELLTDEQTVQNLLDADEQTKVLDIITRKIQPQ